MNLFRVEGDSRATDDLYALSQYPDDRYTSWQRCIVQGIRFRCKESDDKYITQCSGVCVGGEEATVMYYGVLVEILELDFILGRKVFIFRCNWYNSDPKGKSMVVDHNLTSIDTKSKWYMQDPFILANQAQQVFYLNDMSRGKNWMVVQKVNHRNIYDVPEHDEDEVIRNDIFQEADSNELRHFKPIEEINETLSIVRHDVTPESLSYDKVEAINKANPPVVDLETNADDDDDFGSVFVNEEPILNSESDHDSDADYEKTDDDDFFP